MRDRAGRLTQKVQISVPCSPTRATLTQALLIMTPVGPPKEYRAGVGVLLDPVRPAGVLLWPRFSCWFAGCAAFGRDYSILKRVFRAISKRASSSRIRARVGASMGVKSGASK